MPASTASGAWILSLSGTVDAGALPEIARLIQDGRQGRKQIVLDLGEITLLDRAAAHFLADQQRHGVHVVNCPVYIERWINRETND